MAVPARERQLRTCQLYLNLCAALVVQRQSAHKVQTKPVSMQLSVYLFCGSNIFHNLLAAVLASLVDVLQGTTRVRSCAR